MTLLQRQPRDRVSSQIVDSTRARLLKEHAVPVITRAADAHMLSRAAAILDRLRLIYERESRPVQS
jgi:hypothetical protein